MRPPGVDGVMVGTAGGGCSETAGDIGGGIEPYGDGELIEAVLAVVFIMPMGRSWVSNGEKYLGIGLPGVAPNVLPKLVDPKPVAGLGEAVEKEKEGVVEVVAAPKEEVVAPKGLAAGAAVVAALGPPKLKLKLEEG